MAKASVEVVGPTRGTAGPKEGLPERVERLVQMAHGNGGPGSCRSLTEVARAEGDSEPGRRPQRRRPAARQPGMKGNAERATANRCHQVLHDRDFALIMTRSGRSRSAFTVDARQVTENEDSVRRSPVPGRC